MSETMGIGAVTVFADEVVYSGGKCSTNGEINTHVGRINLSNNQWAWHKDILGGTEANRPVSGLAVDASNSKLAVHVTRENFACSWVFVLDTASGHPLSSILKFSPYY